MRLTFLMLREVADIVYRSMKTKVFCSCFHVIKQKSYVHTRQHNFFKTCANLTHRLLHSLFAKLCFFAHAIIANQCGDPLVTYSYTSSHVL